MTGTSLPLALQLHHQNRPQMDSSGQEKDGTTKRDMAVGVTGTSLPLALQLHHQNRPQMDSSGQEKEWTTKRDMAVGVTGTSLPLAPQLHHQNRPQMDSSGQDKEGTTKRDMAAHREESSQYQGIESRHGPRAADRDRWITAAVASRARRR